uniref:Uncharacterized protein n=1 Tax=Anguilla anguilla TaxID=7936 RepID=A0A0E9R9P5_ANGAN
MVQRKEWLWFHQQVSEMCC